MGGWLDLTQQRLSPCKKYRASWRSQGAGYEKNTKRIENRCWFLIGFY